MKYPSKAVITKAIKLYIETLRKPTHVVFCLDISGSMYGNGLKELKEAMNYILDEEQAGKDNLQFSKGDKITIITFDHEIHQILNASGSDTKGLINDINRLEALGGTNIYDPAIEALNVLRKDNDSEYTKTIILMTDGMANSGSFSDLKSHYNKNKDKVPIYSITFGNSSELELKNIAELTNAKVFDGKNGLLRAFTEVRSYN